MASEKGVWPSWLSESWPSWLEKINYPGTGVGDLEDLKFSLEVGESGRWIGLVRPGWYYHNFQEQYNYAFVQSLVVSGASLSGAVSGNFHPQWGPILVHGISDDASGNADGPYREHANSFYPQYQVFFDLLSLPTPNYVELPGSSILIGIRTDNNIDLIERSNEDDSYDNLNSYWYSRENQRAYLSADVFASSTTSSVYLDLVFPDPQLKFREYVICEKNASGNLTIKPSYNQIESLRLKRGAVSQSISGYISSGSVIHTFPNVSPGDWIALEYYISKSFVVKSPTRVEYYCGGSAGSAVLDNFTVYYEGSVPDILQPISLAVPSSAIWPIFNCNPLFEYSYRTGYLFHANPASALNTYWGASKMDIYSDKSVVCRDWGEVAKLKITISEENGIPIPYYPVSISVTGASAILKLPENRTDGRGEVHYLLRPTASASSIVVDIACDDLIQQITISSVASSNLINLDKWDSGQVHLLISNERTNRGAYQSYISATALDGIPKALTGTNAGVIQTKLASELHLNSNTFTQALNINKSPTFENPTGLAAFGYIPQPGDSLFAYSGEAISKIVRGQS